MPKRGRESSISFNKDGYAIIESDGLKFKWHVPENVSHTLTNYSDEFDISIIVLVCNKFMVDIRSLRTNEMFVSDLVEIM